MFSRKPAPITPGTDLVACSRQVNHDHEDELEEAAYLTKTIRTGVMYAERCATRAAERGSYRVHFFRTIAHALAALLPGIERLLNTPPEPERHGLEALQTLLCGPQRQKFAAPDSSEDSGEEEEVEQPRRTAAKATTFQRNGQPVS